MKVAIVQDWLTVNGGAEKVLKEIIKCFPDADLFSLIDFMPAEERADCLFGKEATTSWIQKLPGVKHYYRNLLYFFPKAIESLDFSGYDLIISSSYCVAKGIKKTSEKQIHICYCHSPVRYAWDLKAEYLSGMPFWKRGVFSFIVKRLAKWDIESLDRVDYFIANSKNVRQRIKRIYKRDAEVIYPPVNLAAFEFGESKGDYYFTSCRLVPYKRVDLIVEAFAKLPDKQLIVGGDGPELLDLTKKGGENVTFLGYLPQAKLTELLSKAKAFILAANEDFGISSLEAQASGTPVIALKKGGYLESVLEDSTGVFFEDQTADCLVETIKAFESKNIELEKSKVLEHLQGFSEEAFRNKLLSFVKQKT